MPGLIKSSFCYKYTYPFGMLNYLIGLSGFNFCSDDSRNASDCKDVTNCNDLNQAIARILQQHNIITNTEQSSSQIIDQPSPEETPQSIFVFYGQHDDLFNKDENNYQEFGCSPNMSQVSTQVSSSSNQITDSQASDILNEINNSVNENLKQNGFAEPTILASVQNRVRNHSDLISHIRTKTTSIIDQVTNNRQRINYIDYYQKCGLDSNGNLTGGNISQEITQNSIAKNIIKSTIQQMMKNDDTLKISSTINVSKTQDRIVFFSFIISLLFIYLTYSLFISDGHPSLGIGLLIYFGIIIFVFGILYMEKK
jgi:hypothetical protein